MTEKRDKQVNIRMTESEKKRLKEKADEARLSLTDYLLALSENKKIVVVDGIEDFIQYFGMAVYQISQVKSQIIKVGVNVNQIAQVANTVRSLNDNEVKYVNMNIENIRKYALEVARIENALVEVVSDMTNMLNRKDDKQPKV